MLLAIFTCLYFFITLPSSDSYVNQSYHVNGVDSDSGDVTVDACRQLAATFVDNIIKIASEEAANRLNQCNQTTVDKPNRLKVGISLL